MHGTEFQLRLPGNADFATRQKLLFDKLTTAEEECNKTKTQRSDVGTENVNFVDDVDRSQLLKLGRRTITSRFRGRESIFKRPEGPAPRAASRAIPDFHRNPHRWTRYSLEDVASEDLTDEGNTRAALSFLNELKARRKSERGRPGSKEGETMDSGSTEGETKDLGSGAENKIWFKSRGASKILGNVGVGEESGSDGRESSFAANRVEGRDEKAVFRGSRVVMPEYVVGDKRRRDSKRRVKKEKSGRGVEGVRQLKLAHLEEIDD